MRNPSHPPSINPFQLVGQVGLTMVACILAGTWAGIKLNAWLGGGGAITALGILVGLLAGALAVGVLLYRSIPPWKP